MSDSGTLPENPGDLPGLEVKYNIHEIMGTTDFNQYLSMPTKVSIVAVPNFSWACGCP